MSYSPPNPQKSTNVLSGSATRVLGEYDVIITDPPYYDAIPYSDCMDFFHVWLRRSTHGLSPEVDAAFSRFPLGPKWDHDTDDGELIDDASRFGRRQESLSKQQLRRWYGPFVSGFPQHVDNRTADWS